MKCFTNAFLFPVICLPVMASYPIRIGRPDKVGSVLMVQAEGVQSTKGKMKVDGQPVPFPESQITISANFRWEVLEANDQRKATRLKLTMGKGKCEMDGAPLELPPEGTVIEVRRENGKDVFLLESSALPENLQQALGIVVELGNGRAEDDLQFGTTDPKEVGESWGVNAENILSHAGREMGIVGDPKNVTGKGWLESVVKDRGVDCMKLSIHTEIKNMRSAFFLDKESELKLTNGSMVIDHVGLFPVNPEPQPHALKVHFRFEGKYLGVAGEKGSKAPMEVESVMDTVVDIKLFPIDTGKAK